MDLGLGKQVISYFRATPQSLRHRPWENRPASCDPFWTCSQVSNGDILGTSHISYIISYHIISYTVRIIMIYNGDIRYHDLSNQLDVMRLRLKLRHTPQYVHVCREIYILKPSFFAGYPIFWQTQILESNAAKSARKKSPQESEKRPPLFYFSSSSAFFSSGSSSSGVKSSSWQWQDLALV